MRTKLPALIACSLLTQSAVYVRCLSAEQTHEERPAKVDVDYQPDDQNQSKTSRSEPVERLASRTFASPISLKGDSHQRRITSFEVSLPDADGRGEFEFNQTKWSFDDFGDAKLIGEHRSDKVSVRFQKSTIVDPKDGRRELYEIEFPEKLECNLYLVIAKPADGSRLVIKSGGTITNIIELHSVPIEVDQPAPQSSDKLDLTSEWVPTARGLMEFRIEGDLGGPARFFLNPNYLGFNEYGDVVRSTAVGWGPRTVRLNHVRTESEDGRELFEIVNQSPRKTQYFLVISNRDNQHRLVIREGKTVKHVVRMRAT